MCLLRLCVEKSLLIARRAWVFTALSINSSLITKYKTP